MSDKTEKKLNTRHTVRIEAPLLRPGLTISADCSEAYVVEVAARLLAHARAINTAEPTPGLDRPCSLPPPRLPNRQREPREREC